MTLSITVCYSHTQPHTAANTLTQSGILSPISRDTGSHANSLTLTSLTQQPPELHCTEGSFWRMRPAAGRMIHAWHSSSWLTCFVPCDWPRMCADFPPPSYRPLPPLVACWRPKLGGRVCAGNDWPSICASITLYFEDLLEWLRSLFLQRFLIGCALSSVLALQLFPSSACVWIMLHWTLHGSWRTPPPLNLFFSILTCFS